MGKISSAVCCLVLLLVAALWVLRTEIGLEDAFSSVSSRLGLSVDNTETAGAAKNADKSKPGKKKKIIPVEVAPVEVGSIGQRRIFSGTLESHAEFVVAPKIGGRLKRVFVDLADPVERGQLVGELDSDEYVQAVRQAEAELAVARANLGSATNELATSERDLLRVNTLNKRGVASEAQFDTAKAAQLADLAQKQIADAQLQKASSALELAKIRLSYTLIHADWNDGTQKRFVAERYVDEGDMVNANSPLLRIVELAPIVGVINIAERDYGLIRQDLPVSLTTDAYPGEEFVGKISRVAPAFQTSTRQARVELLIDNSAEKLKPGMFIRATVVLARHEEAIIVPNEALASRGDQIGVFLVKEDDNTVLFQTVRTGLQEKGRVEIVSPPISGRVVTLGQQQLSDGAIVAIRSALPVTP